MDRLDTLPYWAKAFITLLCGVLLSFTQAPYHYWFLIFPCFSLFYIFYASVKIKRLTFLLSFLFAFGYFVSGLNWIGNALLVEGNSYKWAWPLAVIALPVLLSLFASLLLVCAHILTYKKTLAGFFAFSVALGLSEFIRGYIFTGFPWNLFGYTWIDTAISQSVSIWGPFMLTWFTILWGGLFGCFILEKKRFLQVLIFGVLTISITYALGAYRLHQNNTEYDDNVRFAVVQPNIAQSDKWLPEKRDENLVKHIDLSTFDRKAEQNIIIWPETALPLSLISDQAIKFYLKNLTDAQTVLLTGGVSRQINEETEKFEFHNGLFLIDKNQDTQHLYSKSHLVPFGEYIPFQQYIPLAPVTNFTGMAKGAGTQTISIVNMPSFSPQICYEIIFPSAMVHPEDKRPDYILTITNDAWYGDSAGPRQHFAQARFRAIEQGLPVIRSANTGISGVIDPYGRVIKSLPLSLGQADGATINSSLPLKAKHTIYGKIGNLPFIVFIIISIGWLVLIHKKR